MTDVPEKGVLLRGADGSHYFIPHSDLSGFAVDNPSDDVGQHLEANAPRLDAYDVQQASDPSAAAAWFVPGDEEGGGEGDKPV
jgi:hypothetical protein